MISGIRVNGLDKATAGLGKALERFEAQSRSTLVKVGLSIEREAKNNVRDFPLIDTGNLRASCFTMWTEGQGVGLPAFKTTSVKHKGKEIDVESLLSGQLSTMQETANIVDTTGTKTFRVAVSFGAFYALFLHEDGVSRNWVGAKFLENAFRSVTKDMPKLFASSTMWGTP